MTAPLMRGLLTTAALGFAWAAGRAMLRTRAVLLLGRRGRPLAPALVASVWMLAVLTGQVTGSVIGMAISGAGALGVLAAVTTRRFARLKTRAPCWTRLDWAMFLFVAVVFWTVDLWDLDTHRALTAQLLHGNIPPRALNDPRFPLAYHAAYDALNALVVTALPVDFQTAMGIVSIACVALTLANLQALSRILFRRAALAQLGRALFMFGFGPVLVRCAASGWRLEEMHGRTAQSYVDLILRRPAGLGMAFFTFAAALILLAYRGEAREGGRRPIERLVWLLPVLLVLPQISEEATFFVGVYLAPLVLAGRLRFRLIAALLAATVLGALQSGVVLGVLGHRSMATPTLHLCWPPRLPTWAVEQTGVGLLSRDAGGFYALELGPVFVAALLLALAGRDSRRRVMGAAFLAGTAVAVFASTGAWKKSDLDRFLFYGTPPVFMLAADLPDRLWRALRRGRGPSNAVLAMFGLLVCGPTTIYPGWQAEMRLQGDFRANAIGGDLQRALAAVGPREAILTTVDRADALILGGFLVIGPIDTNEVTRVTPAHFDAYVRANAWRAAWLFLPEGDPRVAGRPVVARDGGYVLVRAPATRGGHSS